MSAPNKLTIEEVNSIIAGCKTALAVPEWKELAENTAKLAQQLADAMRENERLRWALGCIFDEENHHNQYSKSWGMAKEALGLNQQHKQSEANGTYASIEEWRKEPPKKSDVEQLQHNAINRGLQTPAKHSENRDWNCEHGIPHKQCGSCYDQKEPPFVEGLGGRFQLPYTKTRLNDES